MVRSYHSVVRRIENARGERRTTDIHPSKPICKEILKLLKRYDIIHYDNIDEYCKGGIKVKLNCSGIPSCINEVNHNRLNPKNLNEKIIKHLKTVELTYKCKGEEYSVILEVDKYPVAYEIARKLSKNYDLSTGRSLS